MELFLVVLVLLVFGVLFLLFHIWTKRELFRLGSRESVSYPEGKPEPLRRSRLVRVYKTERDYILGKRYDEVRESALVLQGVERYRTPKEIAEMRNRFEYSRASRDYDYIPSGEYSFQVMSLGGVVDPVKNSVEFDTEYEESNNSFEVTYADPSLRSLKGYYATEMSLLSC